MRNLKYLFFSSLIAVIYNLSACVNYAGMQTHSTQIKTSDLHLNLSANTISAITQWPQENWWQHIKIHNLII